MGTVYIAKVGNLTKIGYTKNSLKSRLRCAGPDAVLLATLPGTRGTEEEMHDALATWRIEKVSPNGIPKELFAIPDMLLGMMLQYIEHKHGATVFMDNVYLAAIREAA